MGLYSDDNGQCADWEVAMTVLKSVQTVIRAQPASDGDGVQLMRVFGGGMHKPDMFDPFLMMDEFGSYEAQDYIGGFPSHPHRGFETMTYMLEGHMEHRDHMGNIGDLGPGDVQWMTAGGGIVHSEMPKQTEGRMRGFQIWLNLPAKSKMQKADYQDIAAEKFSLAEYTGLSVKLISGAVTVDGNPVSGVVQRSDTEPDFADIMMSDDSWHELVLESAGKTALLYVYEGELSLEGSEKLLAPGELVLLDREGDTLRFRGSQGSRIILLAGKPLNEPIVQYGPFVMNTREEIEQALRDYNSGQFP